MLSTQWPGVQCRLLTSELRQMRRVAGLGDVPYLEDPADGPLVAESTGLRAEEYRARSGQLRQMSAGPEPGAGLIEQTANAADALPALRPGQPLTSPHVRPAERASDELHDQP